MCVHASFSTPGSALLGMSLPIKGEGGNLPLRLVSSGKGSTKWVSFLPCEVSHCTHFSYFLLKNRRKHQGDGVEMRKRGMVRIPLSVGCGFMSLIKCFSAFPSEK